MTVTLFHYTHVLVAFNRLASNSTNPCERGGAMLEVRQKADQYKTLARKNKNRINVFRAIAIFFT
jgi:hypothetical protein